MESRPAPAARRPRTRRRRRRASAPCGRPRCSGNARRADARPRANRAGRYSEPCGPARRSRRNRDPSIDPAGCARGPPSRGRSGPARARCGAMTRRSRRASRAGGRAPVASVMFTSTSRAAHSRSARRSAAHCIRLTRQARPLLVSQYDPSLFFLMLTESPGFAVTVTSVSTCRHTWPLSRSSSTRPLLMGRIPVTLAFEHVERLRLGHLRHFRVGLRRGKSEALLRCQRRRRRLRLRLPRLPRTPAAAWPFRGRSRRVDRCRCGSPRTHGGCPEQQPRRPPWLCLPMLPPP